MNPENIILELDASQAQEVLRIDMDDDAGEALSFIKGNLVRKVKDKLQPH